MSREGEAVAGRAGLDALAVESEPVDERGATPTTTTPGRRPSRFFSAAHLGRRRRLAAYCRVVMTYLARVKIPMTTPMSNASQTEILDANANGSTTTHDAGISNAATRLSNRLLVLRKWNPSRLVWLSV